MKARKVYEFIKTKSFKNNIKNDIGVNRYLNKIEIYINNYKIVGWNKDFPENDPEHGVPLVDCNLIIKNKDLNKYENQNYQELEHSYIAYAIFEFLQYMYNDINDEIDLADKYYEDYYLLYYLEEKIDWFNNSNNLNLILYAYTKEIKNSDNENKIVIILLDENKKEI